MNILSWIAKTFGHRAAVAYSETEIGDYRRRKFVAFVDTRAAVVRPAEIE